MATTILDVSTKGRFLKSPIKGAINIPYDEVEFKLEEIKQMQPIIVCCSVGDLSDWAYNFLKQK